MRSGLVPNLTTRWLCLTLVVKGSSVCEVLAQLSVHENSQHLRHGMIKPYNISNICHQRKYSLIVKKPCSFEMSHNMDLDSSLTRHQAQFSNIKCSTSAGYLRGQKEEETSNSASTLNKPWPEDRRRDQHFSEHISKERKLICSECLDPVKRPSPGQQKGACQQKYLDWVYVDSSPQLHPKHATQTHTLLLTIVM